MPLFGHKNKQPTTATQEPTNPTTGPTGTGIGTHNTTAPGAGTNEPYVPTGGFGGHGHQHYDDGAAGTGVTGTGILGQGQGHHAPAYNNNNQMQGERSNGGYGGTEPGHRTNQDQNPGGIPHTGALNDSNQTRGGSGQAFTGKVERKVGALVGSSALEAKGLQKEQETNSIKLQGSELAEAERLEREALLRRERAVSHGAHPDNKHLGAGLNSGGGGGGGGNREGY